MTDKTPSLLLFKHEDGRYGVAPEGQADFTNGDPKWHRIGPVEVVRMAQAVAACYEMGYRDALSGSPQPQPVALAFRDLSQSDHDEIRAALDAVFNSPETVTRQEIRDQFNAACTATNVLNLLRDRDSLAEQAATQSGSAQPPDCWWIDRGTYGRITMDKVEADRARAESAKVYAYTYRAEQAATQAEATLRSLLEDWVNSFADSIEGGEADELVAATRAALAAPTAPTGAQATPQADSAQPVGADRIVIREDRLSAHRDTRKIPQHHGDCFGTTITPRDGHGDLVELFVEDDEFWHFVTAFDVHWVPELIRMLSLANRAIPAEQAEQCNCGATCQDKRDGCRYVAEQAAPKAEPAKRSLAGWRSLYDNRPESILRGLHFTEFVQVGEYFEALATPPTGVERSEAARDVLAERRRQIEAEGWTPEHDDAHAGGEMAMAAACYAAHTSSGTTIHNYELAGAGRLKLRSRLQSAQEFVGSMWPWARKWWKPADPRRNLVKAGALILAEIERLDRAAQPIAGHQGDSNA